MQSELCSVDAVDKAAKSAANPIALAAESCTTGHRGASSAHASLLIDGLDFTSIELECLCRVSAKDDHISVVQLYTCNWL